MKSTFTPALALFLMTAGAVCAQTTRPDAVVDPKVEAILDRVEAAGDKLTSLTADMDYKRVQTLVDDTVKRKGSVRYLVLTEPNPAWQKMTDEQKKADPSAEARQRVLFRVQFDTLEHGGYVSTKKEIYSFDGRWLIELNERTKQVVHREIVTDDQPLNPVKLGEGPFPAPFGQKKDDVLANFKVELVEPEKGDPKDADHLRLIPRPNSDLSRNYKRIDLFIGRKLDLPIRMETENRGHEVVTVDFENVKLNPNLKAKDFVIERPGNYEETYQRAQSRAPIRRPTAPAIGDPAKLKQPK